MSDPPECLSIHLLEPHRGLCKEQLVPRPVFGSWREREALDVVAPPPH